MSYHNGSIWPHDNAIAAAGLKRYGFDAATDRIATAMFDVASGARDYRLPELFCGFPRDGSRAIIAYPVACIPQAWAAAAPFMLLPGPARHHGARAGQQTHGRPATPARLAFQPGHLRHPRRPLTAEPQLPSDRIGRDRVFTAGTTG